MKALPELRKADCEETNIIIWQQSPRLSREEMISLWMVGVFFGPGEMFLKGGQTNQ